VKLEKTQDPGVFSLLHIRRKFLHVYFLVVSFHIDPVQEKFTPGDVLCAGTGSQKKQYREKRSISVKKTTEPWKSHHSEYSYRKNNDLFGAKSPFLVLSLKK
jgi:hypothetical protein